MTVRATELRDARMERLVEALRAYELVPAPATTANLAAGAGVTRFAAYDLLSRLERQGRVWSVLAIHAGRVTRVWHLKDAMLEAIAEDIGRGSRISRSINALMRETSSSPESGGRAPGS